VAKSGGGIQEHDAVVAVWTTVMSVVEWNKKEDLLQDQVIRGLIDFIH